MAPQKIPTEDVIILSPNNKIFDFGTDPEQRYFKTNNFIQQGISRMMAFDATHGHFQLLKCTEDGEFIVGKSVLYRDSEQVRIANAVALSASGTVVTTEWNCRGFERVAIMVACNKAHKIAVETSPDGDTWFALDDENFAGQSAALAAGNRSIIVNPCADYIRAIVTNDTAEEGVVTVWYHGRV